MLFYLLLIIFGVTVARPLKDRKYITNGDDVTGEDEVSLQSEIIASTTGALRDECSAYLTCRYILPEADLYQLDQMVKNDPEWWNCYEMSRWCQQRLNRNTRMIMLFFGYGSLIVAVVYIFFKFCIDVSSL